MVDASDKFVMPGGIDSSTHLYRGEDGQKLDLADDWASGSKAAVAGKNRKNWRKKLKEKRFKKLGQKPVVAWY